MAYSGIEKKMESALLTEFEKLFFKNKWENVYWSFLCTAMERGKKLRQQ